MSRPLAIAMTIAFLLVACGAGKVVRPDVLRGADALGEAGNACPTAHSTPLVVDWKAEERADLELAMRQGVAVVAYTCDGIKLLPDCHVPGVYGYAGVTQQEEDVQIDNSDELRATLPRMGALLGAQLSAQLDQGTSIDIATLMVGKLRTTVERATRTDLVGTCAEATHFIRGATLGAFAMQQGTRGKIQASADLFGGSGGGSSESSKSMTSKAGQLDACKQADRGDTEPPRQCGAALRVELDAIESPQVVAHEGADTRYVCPKGLVESGGKCARPTTVSSYACRDWDVSECTAQCDRGNAASCVTLGTIYGEGHGVKIDKPRTAELWRKACDLRDGMGCVGLAVMMYRGNVVPKDVDRARQILGRECDAGSFYGCAQLGLVYEMESQDFPRALALETRACNGGDATGCVGVGRLYRDGRGVAKDPARAKEYFARSCAEGTGMGIGCGELGKLYDLGLGVAKDDATAFHYIELGCKMPMAIDTCLGAADYSEQARGTTRDLPRAFHFLVLGCQQGNAATCARLARVMSRKNPPDPRATRNMYARACDLGDAPSCEAMKALP